MDRARRIEDGGGRSERVGQRAEEREDGKYERGSTDWDGD